MTQSINSMSTPVLLASAPLHCLERAIQLTLQCGGEYSAGDAEDKLNADILDPRNEAWKTAWKGKTSQCHRMLSNRHPETEIFAVVIKGGPACEWERYELNCTFSTILKNLTVVEVDDLGSYMAWLQCNFPGVAERDGTSSMSPAYSARGAVWM